MKELKIVIETYLDDELISKSENQSWQTAETEFYRQMRNFERKQTEKVEGETGEQD